MMAVTQNAIKPAVVLPAEATGQEPARRPRGSAYSGFSLFTWY